jgi:hypothetical protein
MRSTVLLLVMLLVPASAAAQEVSHSFADLNRKGTLTEGEQIFIMVDLSGNGDYEELKTELLGLSDSTISIKVDSLPHERMQNVSRSGNSWQVEVPEDRVQWIEQKDGPSGALGALIGAVAGGTVGVFVGMEEDLEQDSGGAYAMLGGLVGGAAGGLAVGFLFRSMNSEEMLYSSMGSTEGSLEVSLSPLLTKNKKGALLTLTW